MGFTEPDLEWSRLQGFPRWQIAKPGPVWPSFGFQSQSEQSGSEQDSAVESPIVDSVDSDSQQVLKHFYLMEDKSPVSVSE